MLSSTYTPGHLRSLSGRNSFSAKELLNYQPPVDIGALRLDSQESFSEKSDQVSWNTFAKKFLHEDWESSELGHIINDFRMREFDGTFNKPQKIDPETDDQKIRRLTRFLTKYMPENSEDDHVFLSKVLKKEEVTRAKRQSGITRTRKGDEFFSKRYRTLLHTNHSKSHKTIRFHEKELTNILNSITPRTTTNEKGLRLSISTTTTTSTATSSSLSQLPKITFQGSTTPTSAFTSTFTSPRQHNEQSDGFARLVKTIMVKNRQNPLKFHPKVQKSGKMGQKEGNLRIKTKSGKISASATSSIVVSTPSNSVLKKKKTVTAEKRRPIIDALGLTRGHSPKVLRRRRMAKAKSALKLKMKMVVKDNSEEGDKEDVAEL